MMLNFAQFVIMYIWNKFGLLNITTLVGAEGFTTEEDQDLLSRIEKQLKKRFAIGSQVSEHAIVQDFLRQVRYKFDNYINRLFGNFWNIYYSN